MIADALLRFLDELRSNFRVADLLDVGVVSFLLYFLMLWLRQRASRPLAVSVSAVLLVFILARRLEMVLTSMVFQAGLTALLFALVLVFQDDIRRAFEQFATWSAGRGSAGAAPRAGTVDLLVEAVGAMARERTGALIVLAGREPVERHTRGGIEVGARLSLPLLLSIFDDSSPGHDGAIVIERDRITRLGVHLPLSTNLEAVRSRGMRHTAALGLAEACDALVLVASEERGTISVAEHGELLQVSEAELAGRLRRFLTQQAVAGVGVPGRRRRNLGLKAAAVALGAVLWLLFAYRAETVQRIFEAPIELRNLPRDLELAAGSPSSARITLAGSQRVFELLDPTSLLVSVDVRDIPQTGGDVDLRPQSVKRPSGLQVLQIEPTHVRLARKRSLPP